jgi:hypothetical protein
MSGQTGFEQFGQVWYDMQHTGGAGKQIREGTGFFMKRPHAWKISGSRFE